MATVTTLIEKLRAAERSGSRDSRWIADIAYRGEGGFIEVHHHIEELEELHDIVEYRPDWHAIAKLEVRLSPHRNLFPNDTLESAVIRGKLTVREFDEMMSRRAPLND